MLAIEHHVGGAQAAVLVEGLRIAYNSEFPVVTIRRLAVNFGEVVALMGPSGSGKTSILRCLMGLDSPAAGRLHIGGVDVDRASASRRAELRRQRMAIVFQEPRLLPELNVEDNVALPLILRGTPRPRARLAAAEALEAVEIAHVRHHRVDQISGGEAQRVAIARGLCPPGVDLLLADEPTASLDRRQARLVSDLILKNARKRAMSGVIATHDPSLAGRCDRVVHVDRVVAE